MKIFRKINAIIIGIMLVILSIFTFPTSGMASNEAKIQEAIDSASSQMLTGEIRSEWQAIGLKRAGKEIPSSYEAIFQENVTNQVINRLQNNRVLITDIERLSIA